MPADNKEIIKQSFKCGDTPTNIDFAKLIDGSVGVLTDVLQLPPPSSAVLNTCYKINNVFYTCNQKPDNTFEWQAFVIGGGISNYNDLTNRPRINGVILSGDVTPNNLGILRDNGGYTLVNPIPNDVVNVIRSGVPFVCRVSDLIRATAERQDIVLLEDITNTPPVIFDAIVGFTKYFNTTDNLIYTADTLATWNAAGFPATERVLYINKANNGLYRFEGAMLQVLGGGGGGGGGDAAAWLEGSGTPSNSLGNIGDWYLNIATGDAYKKTASTTWTFKLNIKGADGTNGWLPVISVVTDGERRVLRLTDWTGGTGTKPSIPANNYITNTGLGTLANAEDIRGANGKNIELQVNSTHIQWRLVGDTSWINLISLDLLKGQNGTSPNITIGTVTTVAAGQQANATITGTFPNLILNLSIPKGADGSATEGGVTQQYIDNAIVLHNEDEENHQDIRQSVANLVPAVVEGEEGENEDNEIILTPVPNTYYKFGELNMLKLENIPTSMLPIVIWFSSADTDTSLVFPEGTKMLSGSAEIEANSVYELSIVNGIVAIAKIVISG